MLSAVVGTNGKLNTGAASGWSRLRSRSNTGRPPSAVVPRLPSAMLRVAERDAPGLAPKMLVKPEKPGASYDFAYPPRKTGSVLRILLAHPSPTRGCHTMPALGAMLSQSVL